MYAYMYIYIYTCGHEVLRSSYSFTSRVVVFCYVKLCYLVEYSHHLYLYRVVLVRVPHNMKYIRHNGSIPTSRII